MNNGNGSVFERHAQTALTVLVVGLLAWVGVTTQTTAIDVAKLTVKVEQLEQEIRDLRELLP